MRTVRDIKDIQIVLNELLDWKQRLETKANDMHGLQIKNLGAASASTDATTRGELEVSVSTLRQELVLKLQEVDTVLQKVRAALKDLGYPIR